MEVAIVQWIGFSQRIVQKPDCDCVEWHGAFIDDRPVYRSRVTLEGGEKTSAPRTFDARLLYFLLDQPGVTAPYWLVDTKPLRHQRKSCDNILCINWRHYPTMSPGAIDPPRCASKKRKRLAEEEGGDKEETPTKRHCVFLGPGRQNNLSAAAAADI